MSLAEARYGCVGPPYWSTVYIIGGGPSLRNADFSYLEGRTVLAVNDAIRYMPEASAVVSIDHNWARNRRAELEAFAARGGEAYLAVPAEREDLFGYAGVTYLERSREQGLSDDPGRLHIGGNSGYAALNLAYLKGAKMIILLGYDMAGGHWHDGYPWGVSSGRYMEGWAHEFETTRSQLAAADVSVINASGRSRIQAFQRVERTTILPDLVQA